MPEAQLQEFKTLLNLVMLDVDALAARNMDQSKMCKLARQAGPILTELEAFREAHKK